jgi:2-dehydropantoate 2-reductase
MGPRFQGVATDSQEARILVIGAGVNGSICAARLREAGRDVTVLARGRRVDEIRSQGIVIEDVLRNTRTVTQVPVVDALRPDDLYDYILVIVRKNQVADLLPTLRNNRSPSVVFMVNNPSGPASGFGRWAGSASCWALSSAQAGARAASSAASPTSIPAWPDA